MAHLAERRYHLCSTIQLVRAGGSACVRYLAEAWRPALGQSVRGGQFSSPVIMPRIDTGVCRK